MPMTMSFLSPMRALAALICILICTSYCSASDSTVTSTITSSTIVTTSTTTITLGQSTFASTTEIPVTTIPPSASSSSNSDGMSSGSNAGSGNGVYSGNSFQDAVLNSTNLYRKAYQANPVTWDDTLASYAQNYAEKCVWEHSGGDYGENLALGYATPTLAIDAWANEEAKYNFGKGKFGEKTGHFTQLVWQNTKRVGCGAVNCDNGDVQGWMLVCEYDPPGNVQGEFKENVEKAGDNDGQLGMGAASAGGLGGVSRVLMVLLGVSAVAAGCQ